MSVEDEDKDKSISQTDSNGTMWIFYGAAIINACRSITYVEFGEKGKKVFDMNENSTKLSPVKKWVKEIFERRLNLHSLEPCFNAVMPSRKITLWSTSIVPVVSEENQSAPKDVHKLMAEMQVRKDSLLLDIPLTPETMGCDFAHYELICGDLQKMVAEVD